MRINNYAAIRLMKWTGILSVGVLSACHSFRPASSVFVPEKKTVFAPGPQALVYKTVNDYSLHVPVLMNEDKTEIVSFPAPGDLSYRGKPAVPVSLTDGYWLDNRGIGIYVAFLEYTYEEYSQLPETPSREDLMKRIIDQNPLCELWSCGLRSQYRDEITELNELIRAGFPGCRKLY